MGFMDNVKPLMDLIAMTAKEVPTEVWPKLAMKSPVIRGVLLSKEGIEATGILSFQARQLRVKLTEVMLKEGLITKDEAPALGVVQLLHRFGDHIKAMGGTEDVR
jgi:hypothetical protein